ncbi:hypothetical protein [Scytonema hofmannii]|nr:hypothetical protein [Scytonema hofmannii]
MTTSSIQIGLLYHRNNVGYGNCAVDVNEDGSAVGTTEGFVFGGLGYG